MTTSLSWVWIPFVGVAVAGVGLRAEEKPASSGQSIPSPSANELLSASLRTLLLQSFPDPLYEAQPGWGKTKSVWTGIRAKGKGIRAHLEGKYEERNHGSWQKIRATAPNLPNTLKVDIRDLRNLSKERMTFSVSLVFNAHVDYPQQKWASGVRLYDASVRARCRVTLSLQCESILRVEKVGGWLPNFVYRLRVLQSDFHYDKLVCEHIAGFGGTTAKVIGDTIVGILKRFRPGLEQKLLARVNAAIVKAGDTRESRLGLGKLPFRL
jgi:hypothetical protein